MIESVTVTHGRLVGLGSTEGGRPNGGTGAAGHIHPNYYAAGSQSLR